MSGDLAEIVTVAVQMARQAAWTAAREEPRQGTDQHSVYLMARASTGGRLYKQLTINGFRGTDEPGVVRMKNPAALWEGSLNQRRRGAEAAAQELKDRLGIPCHVVVEEVDGGGGGI